MNEELKYYKFSDTAATHCPNILNGLSPKQFLDKAYTVSILFGLDGLLKTGTYKIAGYSFDFKPFLKRFLINQHGNWIEYYAPNKTKLGAAVYETIDEIVEIKKKQ